MIRKLAVLIAVLVAATPLLATPEKDAVVRFFELREKTLDQRGTPADVDRLLALLSDTVIYEHPNAGVVMNKDQARAGMLAHLNEGKDATYTLRHARFGKDFAVVEMTLDYTVEGKEMKRTGVFVFEFSGSKISRLAAYTN